MCVSMHCMVIDIARGWVQMGKKGKHTKEREKNVPGGDNKKDGLKLHGNNCSHVSTNYDY